MVVVGHWLTTSVYWDEAGTRGVNALSVVPWTRPVTWLIQVMPILFFVGGFANAEVAARFPNSYLGYLRTRLARLMIPTAVMFSVWGTIGLLLVVTSPPRGDVLEHAASIAAIPLWFLGIYVVVVALAPSLLALHRRFGAAVVVVMVVGAAAVDALRLPGGVEAVATLNYAFVWLFAHQLGFWYRDGRLSRRVTGRAMAAVGLGGLVALTTIAGYPVSMVGVPGQPRWNTDPPSLAIVALTIWLVGLVMVLRRPITRLWRARSRTLRRGHGRLLTMFLWHVTAIPIAVLALYPLGFPQPATGSAEWWAWRPAWIAALGVAMFVLVRAFGRFEVRARPAAAAPSSPNRIVGAGLAVFSFTAAILGSALTGFSDPFGEGRELLVFRLNPFQNLIHLVLGAAGATAAVRRSRAGNLVPLVVATGLAAAGALGMASPSSLSPLAWNEATAALHLVVGATALALLAAFALARARTGP